MFETIQQKRARLDTMRSILGLLRAGWDVREVKEYLRNEIALVQGEISSRVAVSETNRASLGLVSRPAPAEEHIGGN